ncbi:MAG: IPTL-CTERM sorting domain-containing protein, partial [candidate division NC10 bacterium]|nr:IPTL-CTERM sorting domain-containing protein [candidate division NC10 bacterium]
TNAAASVTNTAVVSGGGETNTSNDSASDPTTVDPVSMPDLTITKTHVGDFTLGQTGATYTLTVTNVGSAPTSGTVTVVDTLPTGLTATGIAGAGWTCDLNTLTCTRADALGAGSSYPVITLTVDVAANAPSTITNGASVSGGGETNTGNNAASDPATVGVPSDIPTLSEWVMILLALLLALEGVRSLRTRINR